MLSENRFYGVYRGVIADGDDPLELGRVKLYIPQILGEAVTDWAWPLTGSINQINYPYGTFITNAAQTIEVNTPTIVTNWVADDTNKTYKDGNKLYVEETGDYFLQFSAMFIKTSANAGTADLWVRKNGADVADTNTRVTLSGSNAETVMTVGLILDLNAGDYVQLVSSASATNTQIHTHAAGVGPAIPGVIATLNLVGKWKPKPNTPAWAMFEGGDPNFPVWVGVL